MTGRKKIPLFNLVVTDDMGSKEPPADLWSEGPEVEWEDPTFDEVVRRQEFQQRLGVSLPWEILTEKQRFVLRASWGMDGEGLSFQEVADLMGVTASSVHRIYGRAMASLRKAVGVTNSP